MVLSVHAAGMPGDISACHVNNTVEHWNIIQGSMVIQLNSCTHISPVRFVEINLSILCWITHCFLYLLPIF